MLFTNMWMIFTCLFCRCYRPYPVVSRLLPLSTVMAMVGDFAALCRTLDHWPVGQAVFGAMAAATIGQLSRSSACALVAAAARGASSVPASDACEKGPSVLAELQEVLDVLGVSNITQGLQRLREGGRADLAKRAQRLSKARNAEAHPDVLLGRDVLAFVGSAAGSAQAGCDAAALVPLGALSPGPVGDASEENFQQAADVTTEGLVAVPDCGGPVRPDLFDIFSDDGDQVCLEICAGTDLLAAGHDTVPHQLMCPPDGTLDVNEDCDRTALHGTDVGTACQALLVQEACPDHISHAKHSHCQFMQTALDDPVRFPLIFAKFQAATDDLEFFVDCEAAFKLAGWERVAAYSGPMVVVHDLLEAWLAPSQTGRAAASTGRRRRARKWADA